MARSLPTAYLDGQFQPIEDVRISPLDRGFLFGDAVYEVVPVHDGRPLLIDAHIARLARSLAEIQIPDPYGEARWRQLIAELIARNGGGDVAVYLQVSRGAEVGRDQRFPANAAPTVFAMATEYRIADYAQGAEAITRADDRWARCDIKSTSLLANVLARQAAHEAGAIDAILLADGHVTEGSVSSVLIVENGEIVRRPHGNAVLPGTTTDFVVEIARASGIICHEQPIPEDRLRGADELWLTGAVKGIAPVVRLDGQPIGDGRPGAVWRTVQDGFMREISD